MKITEITKKTMHFISKSRLRLNPHPPIIVWQMGKVGSSSVYKSLKQMRLISPVFHIHFLNPDNLNRVKNEFDRKGLPIPKHINDGKILLDRYKKSVGDGWKIITIVRELPKIMISGFFQNIERWSHDHAGLLTKTGDINTDLAFHLLKKQLCNFDESKDYVCTWFDREIKQMLKIDVFSQPFDHEKGYTTIRKNNIDVLILKTELLDSTFSEAISGFLDIDRQVRLINTNISEKKYYSKAIKQIRNELVIPHDVLHRINSSKYMRHFYPSKNI